MRNAILFTIIVLISGCTIGRKMSFNNNTVTPNYTEAKVLVVAFQENRKEVLNGARKPSYCGAMKSTGQIAYNIQTNSGKPLVDEFTWSLVGSLSKLGIRTQALAVAMNADSSAFVEQFMKTDGERLLHFTVKQWEANATPRVFDIRYDVTWEFVLDVYDRSGKMLASKTVANRLTKDEGQLAASKEYLQKMADQVFVEQMKNLLNDPAIKASLVN